MFIHGRSEEAEALVDDIERQVKASAGRRRAQGAEEGDQGPRAGDASASSRSRRPCSAPTRGGPSSACRSSSARRSSTTPSSSPTRSCSGTFYDVKPAAVGYYIIPFAIGNFLGPLVLGRLFDSVGRKPMIAGTYIVSGVLLIVTAFLFRAGDWTAETQTAAWCVIFFFASAGASSAYLTVSEIFPMETRALAIAFFYAVGTAAGGITGPLLFGKLVESEDAGQVFWGYMLGAALMIGAGIVQALIGVEAAQKDLEQVAKPLSAEAAEGEDAGEAERDDDAARGERRPRRELEPRFERPHRPERGAPLRARSEARLLLLPGPAVLLARPGRGRRRGGRDDRRRAARGRRRRPRPPRARRARALPPLGAGALPPRAVGRPAAWAGPARRRAAATSPRRARAREPRRGRSARANAARRNLTSDQCPSADRTALGAPWVQRNQFSPKGDLRHATSIPSSHRSSSPSACWPRRRSAPRRPPRSATWRAAS